MSDPRRRARALADAFRARTGHGPDGVWAAPGRVNLVGEHTDYNGGLVLPLAIDRETLAAVGRRADGLVTCASLDRPGEVAHPVRELAPGAVTGWSAYPLGVTWALRELGLDVPGLDLLIASDVPPGAGLSSSAALTAAVGLAIVELVGAGVSPVAGRDAGRDAGTDLDGTKIDRTTLALAARRAETDVVGAPVGIMDQMAALHGRSGCALLLDCRSLRFDPVPLPLDELDARVIVIDTQVSHAHAGGEYARRRQTCQRAAALLGVESLRDADLATVEALADAEARRCARHVVTEIARVGEVARAFATRDLVGLGRLFAASHASMRDDFRISCAEIDVAVESALAAGAAAARLTGGGFGGCAVALVPTNRVAEVTIEIATAFAGRDFHRPSVFAVSPAAGAHRIG